MFTKSIFTAAALAVALPFTAFAASPNEGQAMQAAILNVDPAAFTSNELAQIAAERGDQNKAERAALILAQRNGTSDVTNGGPDAFTSNELARIDAETSDIAKAERAAQIRSEKTGATVSTLGDKSMAVGYVHHGRDDA